MATVVSETSWETREAGENFPVALRLLPRRHREHLHAVYGYARHVDELGDSLPGGPAARVAALEDFRAQTRVIWTGGEVATPLLRRLAATVADARLSEQPFLDLVEANLQDQRVSRYSTRADVLAYCHLSADPVGRIVLELFGASTPARIALSDRVCTALQIVEHLQDVGEDRRAGRVYLPQESLASYDVDEHALDARPAPGVTPPALRALVLAEADCAAEMLHEGSALVGQLRGWARTAVAGFVAGGLAVVDALHRIDGDVLGRHAAPAKRDVVRHALTALVRGRA
ncbi:squalene synthase HpnC [Nocardioides sp. DS6]|uniref:Squalene synthase HpnC n=1 Tax=Nocardioides eburneus TaxID=3231482 RepID=A0ABV3SWW9_9ACTN